MSHIDKLIQELCPDGVKHVSLSEIARYSPTRIDASELDETSFVGVDNLVADKKGRIDSSYPPNTARLTAYEPGDVLLGNIRPYLKKVWLATNSGGCSGDVLAVRIVPAMQSDMVPQFLYYLLSSDEFFSFNMQHAKGAKMPRGSKVAIMDYRIPVPPMEVQREIISILDKFTALEAELEAELEARKQQYEHYRSSCLDVEKLRDVRNVRIGDICSIVRGRVISKDYLRDHAGPYPVYSSQTQNEGIFGRIDTYAFDDECLTWTTDGANAGSVFYHHNEKFSITNVCGRLKVSDPEVLTKYLFYQLQIHAPRAVSAGMGNPKLMAGPMSRVIVPIPNMVDQRQIVERLDAFDALTTDLSVGLPAELAARRKQYDYYRDRLLTFKELEVQS